MRDNADSGLALALQCEHPWRVTHGSIYYINVLNQQQNQPANITADFSQKSHFRVLQTLDPGFWFEEMLEVEDKLCVGVIFIVFHT